MIKIYPLCSHSLSVDRCSLMWVESGVCLRLSVSLSVLSWCLISDVLSGYWSLGDVNYVIKARVVSFDVVNTGNEDLRLIVFTVFSHVLTRASVWTLSIFRKLLIDLCTASNKSSLHLILWPFSQKWYLLLSNFLSFISFILGLRQIVIFFIDCCGF